MGLGRYCPNPSHDFLDEFPDSDLWLGVLAPARQLSMMATLPPLHPHHPTPGVPGLAEGLFDDLHSFDPATMVWTPLFANKSTAKDSGWPAARAWHGFASAGGMLYVHGGYSKLGMCMCQQMRFLLSTDAISEAWAATQSPRVLRASESRACPVITPAAAARQRLRRARHKASGLSAGCSNRSRGPRSTPGGFFSAES